MVGTTDTDTEVVFSETNRLTPFRDGHEKDILTERNRLVTEYEAIEKARADGDLSMEQAAINMSELIIAGRAKFKQIRDDRDAVVKSWTFAQVANPVGGE